METKLLAQKWFEELWNKKNPAVIAELMDATAAGVTEGGPITGPAQFKTMVYEPLLAAFPDVKVKIDGVIAEKDDVAIRWTVTATHKGALAHLGPTGKRVTFSGMTWQRFRNGKIIAGCDSYNLHGVLAFLATDNECASVRRA